jgi:hypothetical protein
LEAIKLLREEKRATKIVGVRRQKIGKILKIIEKILKIIEKYTTIVDVSIQQHPGVIAYLLFI